MLSQHGDNIGSTPSWILGKEYWMCVYSESTSWYPQTFHHRWQAGKWNTVAMAITGHRGGWAWTGGCEGEQSQRGHRGGRWGLREDIRTRDLVEGGLPQPALCIHDVLKEHCHAGPLPGLSCHKNEADLCVDLCSPSEFLYFPTS